MTLLSTKYNAAKNWTGRLPIAREICKEVRAEREAREAAADHCAPDGGPCLCDVCQSLRQEREAA